MEPINSKEAFQNLLERLVREGIEVSMVLRDGVMKYDLHTGMKSDLYISFAGDSILVEGRYDHKRNIIDWDDLMWEVKCCLHGRDYMSCAWNELLLKEGILEKVVTENVTYR